MTNAKNRANMRCVKFSPEQLAQLFQGAKQEGMSETDYIRWKVVGAVPGNQRRDAQNKRRRRERAQGIPARKGLEAQARNGTEIEGGPPEPPRTVSEPDLTDFNTELAVARVTRLDIPRVRELVAKGELKIVNGDVVLAGRLVGKL